MKRVRVFSVLLLVSVLGIVSACAGRAHQKENGGTVVTVDLPRHCVFCTPLYLAEIAGKTKGEYRLQFRTPGDGAQAGGSGLCLQVVDAKALLREERDSRERKVVLEVLCMGSDVFAVPTEEGGQAPKQFWDYTGDDTAGYYAELRQIALKRADREAFLRKAVPKLMAGVSFVDERMMYRLLEAEEAGSLLMSDVGRLPYLLLVCDKDMAERYGEQIGEIRADLKEGFGMLEDEETAVRALQSYTGESKKVMGALYRICMSGGAWEIDKEKVAVGMKALRNLLRDGGEAEKE